jgi:hypothetical protein
MPFAFASPFGIFGVRVGGILALGGMRSSCSFGIDLKDDGKDDGEEGKELYDHECDEMGRTRLMVTCLHIGPLETLS